MKKILLLSLFFLSVLLPEAMAQTKTITGRVTEGATGEGMPGVTVQLKGTSTAAPTDVNGNYTITVPSTAGTLVFSFIGYTDQEVSIGNRTTVNVQMRPDAIAMGEVVVVGAGGIERQVKEQGYSTTQVTNEELTQGRSPNIATGLTGKVAGLQINAVGSGVNPTVRVVLRGNRSLLGNNQALIVLDNVIVPNEILGNLNPEDIENISVLNGAAGAALYGSDASNGALVITTKKGKRGVTSVRVAHTTTLEQVSFFPKLQTSFGSGYEPGVPEYVPYENQQYGPRFDGSMVQIGKPLADGSVQTVPYSARDDKFDFWETGVQNQTDVSLSAGSDRSNFYMSAQRFNSQGTTPGDEYDRIAVRVNGAYDVTPKLKFSFNTNFTQNEYDITSATAAAYQYLLNTPAHIPLLNYRDWRNNPFANPNGYFNEYYPNPYFAIDNNRQNSRNNYLIGNVEVKFAPVDWMDVTYRIGLSNRNYINKSTTGIFTYTPYTKSISPSKTDVAGGVSDNALSTNQLNSDLLVGFYKDLNEDFEVKLILGNAIRENRQNSIGISANGLVIPGLYNVTNRIGNPGAGEGSYLARQVGVFGDVTVGFRDYLFLHVTGRNDWTSILEEENRSFFYPSVDVAFTASEAIPVLQDNQFVNNLKLRAGWAKVGQVNLASSGRPFGAYSLLPTFGVGGGFPFGSVSGFTVGNQIVAPNLKPEITTSLEFGFDAVLVKEMVETKFTYYSTSTENQTLPAQLSTATGFTTLLTNTGEVTNKGIETVLRVTPYRTENLTVTVGGNYTYNENRVESIAADLPRLALSTGGAAQVYAEAGNMFPILRGTDFARDPQGRIIVDRHSGYPTNALEPVNLGNTEPMHRLGLDFEVRFLKNFRFTTLFEYRGNFYRYHNGGSTFDFSGASERSASFNRDRFVIPNSVYEDPENPGTYIPNTNITVANGSADFWANGRIMDVASTYVSRADYWRLREASLAFEVPRAFLERTRVIKGATISLQGRNLFLWLPESNQWTDPDYNFTDTNAIGITTLGQTPPTRYYGATLSINF
ncbi:SusC/RagA family TonB-linked outer membrane protein [Rufibacter roseus]|uniref:SusC/RagA family TonB-linked outer membrane protein n=1 Tax=Rufibacter roseus TaxID=1567108 RepID=A0ABW2DE04_9BACT|nr:SusC/RagA family TonB-linked outer membrane protein [Rufibacter roseus]